MPRQDNIETILRPGQLVGANYRVDRLIAKGGMAAVWAGVNLHNGKRVALKVILRSFASNDEVVELFRREALAASKVNHPNVVDIFDVIDHEGMTCIVMELFDGETLGNYLARNAPLSLERALALLLPAMRGVAAANAQGVVHRDLKPANIFLCCGPSGQLVTIKVLDFGISVMMKRVGETAPVTELLAMFGTPAYMAPEAIEFSPNIDGRADVYGFGVLLFEALTGKLPFPGPPGLDLLKHILTDSPPKVTLYRSDLPADVVNLIACALSKDPNERFADMGHLIRAVEDRLLPLLPSPRSLTPISGISLLPLAASSTGVLAPVVHAVFEKEARGLVHLRETRALYSMTKPPSIHHPRRTLNRRTSTGAAVVIFLIVIAWVAVPASSGDRAGTQEQLAPTAKIPVRDHGPLVTPLPEVPNSAPAPAITADAPSNSAIDRDSAPVHAPFVATLPRIRPARPHPVKRVSHPEVPTPRHRMADSPEPSSAPRAGRLSASDF